MRSEQEIRQIKEELEKLTSFTDEQGADVELDSKTVEYAFSICDELHWFLQETPPESFAGDARRDLERIKQIYEAIERRRRKACFNSEQPGPDYIPSAGCVRFAEHFTTSQHRRGPRRFAALFGCAEQDLTDKAGKV
ncbi:hypothetical protein ES707_04926 [subsurface metagenome]